MPIAVRPTAIWSLPRIALVASATGSFAGASDWILGEVNAATNYTLSAWIIFPILLASNLLLPIGFIVLFYLRLPRFQHGLVYAVTHAVAWALLMVAVVLSDAGLLLGVSIMATAQVAILISAWLACRLFRGKVLINNGTLCNSCGYNLTGNLSGKCPECGSSIAHGP